MKAGQHLLKSGANVQAKLPALPVLNMPPKALELKYLYDDLKPVVQAPYKLMFEDGTMIEGILDANGYAKVQVPADKNKPKVYYGFSSVEAKSDHTKPENTFKDNKIMTLAEAEQLIEQYNKQELDILLDEYFPDEIQSMIDGHSVEYVEHINDYVEQSLEQENSSSDAIEDNAEEIPLNVQATPHFSFGGEE